VDAGHPDLIQSFSVNGEIARNIVFERNLCVDGDTQICQLSDDNSMGMVTNWTFRNNVFARIGSAANCGIGGCKWYNNTFYRCTTNTGQVLNFQYDQVRGISWKGEVKNNAFVECVDGTAGRGWYASDTNLTDFVADYNYVGGTNGAPKSSTFQEAHGVNGGNPVFMYPPILNFDLSATSCLVDKGTTISGFSTDIKGRVRPKGAAWDIGAVECLTNRPVQSPLNLRVVP
jgi:hypothetical protein